MARNAIWHGVDALGLQAGDQVLMPSYHHGIEVQTLRAKNLRVQFYRVDAAMHADLDDVQRKLGSECHALYMIHYLGFPQPIEVFQRMARERGVPLIEDCALSLFSRTSTKHLGSYGDISVFCLYKSLPVPHGGMLVLNRGDLPMPPEPAPPDRISTFSYVLNRLLDGYALNGTRWGPTASRAAKRVGRTLKRMLGRTVTPIDTENLDVGMIDLGASPIVHRIVERTDAATVARVRRQNFARLLDRIGKTVRPGLPSLPEGTCPLGFPILVRDKLAVQKRLLMEGIESVNLWSRRHPEVPEGAFPEVEFLRRHVLEIPIHQGIRELHVDYIAEKLRTHARW